MTPLMTSGEDIAQAHLMAGPSTGLNLAIEVWGSSFDLGHGVRAVPAREDEGTTFLAKLAMEDGTVTGVRELGEPGSRPFISAFGESPTGHIWWAGANRNWMWSIRTMVPGASP
jgi:hypothetical protein